MGFHSSSCLNDINKSLQPNILYLGTPDNEVLCKKVNGYWTKRNFRSDTIGQHIKGYWTRRNRRVNKNWEFEGAVWDPWISFKR